MTNPKPFSHDELIEHASSAVRKVDRDGERGATNVNQTEVLAMAALLVCLGLQPYRSTNEQPAIPEVFIVRSKAQ